jgi:hypothetical protein
MPRKSKQVKRGKFEVKGCAKNNTLETPCCQSRVCKEHVLNALRVCAGIEPPDYVYIFPVCGEEKSMHETMVAELMSECCAFTRAKVMDMCCEGKVVVAHMPCRGSGCFECSNTYLEVRTLV